PHPRFRLRSFVLQPLNDIAENYIDPITHLTITQLLANCPDQAPITCFTKEL
ncbi:MAG: 7,8-dihydro-6-hydroxymethylpterin-pyrophosphokinase, partial [Flavobacteriaceae bacterium]